MLRAVPRHPRKASVQDIKHRLADAGFPVSLRTIQRDLVELSGPFPLVSDERAKPYGWSWQANAPVFDLPNLSNQEALAFAMIESYLRPLLPDAILKSPQPHFVEARKRLAKPDLARGHGGWLAKIAVAQPTQALIPPSVDRRVHEAVTDALLQDRQLSVKYRRKGERELRGYVLNPMGLVQRGPVTYLVATAREHENALLFALHRFEHATALSEQARRPRGFDLQQFVRSGGSDFGTGKKIRLEAMFDPAAAEHLSESPLSSDQRLGATSNGQVRLLATVFDTPQLRWWLLGFGDCVEVISPTDLREYFSETVTAMARFYGT